jgi:hypothetical protein
VNWSEEKYVKLFTRDTPTWRSWPWQARATAPLLMRALEGEGSLSVGRLDVNRAVAVTVNLPEEVVAPGLAAMLDDGTLALNDGRLWWPKFEEAQESRKSDAQKQRDYRDRKRRKEHGTAVTGRYSALPSSPAQPSTAQTAPSELPREKPAATKASAKAADPHHASLRAALIEVFRRKRGAQYPFDYGREDAEVRRLLKLGLEPVVLAAWERALDSKYPTVSTLAKFRLEFPRFVGRGEGGSTSASEPAAPRPEGRTRL